MKYLSQNIYDFVKEIQNSTYRHSVRGLIPAGTSVSKRPEQSTSAPHDCFEHVQPDNLQILLINETYGNEQ